MIGMTASCLATAAEAAAGDAVDADGDAEAGIKMGSTLHPFLHCPALPRAVNLSRQ